MLFYHCLGPSLFAECLPTGSIRLWPLLFPTPQSHKHNTMTHNTPNVNSTDDKSLNPLAFKIFNNRYTSFYPKTLSSQCAVKLYVKLQVCGSRWSLQQQKTAYLTTSNFIGLYIQQQWLFGWNIGSTDYLGLVKMLCFWKPSCIYWIKNTATIITLKYNKQKTNIKHLK